MSQNNLPDAPTLGRELHRIGVIMAAIGVIVFLFLGIASFVVEFLIGASFLTTGVAGGFAALYMRHTRVFVGAAILSALTLLIGLYLVLNPVSGLIAPTVLICIILLVEGLFQLTLAYDLMPRSGWVWMLGSAIISILVGLIVLFGLPGSSRIVLGALLGFSFFSTGLAFITSADNISEL